MRKVKQFFGALLVCTVLIAAISSCGSTSGNADKAANSTAGTASAADTVKDDGTVKEHMDISVALWGIDEALANANSDQFLQAMYKTLNISLLPRQITWDDYTQKAQIWSATGDMPDIMAIDAVGTSYYRNWVNQGVIRAVPDDLSQYTTLSNYLNKPDMQSLKENGKLYCIPRGLYDSLDYNAQGRMVFYRWDLAQKAGITKEPATWDEFKAMLKAIVEKDPEGKNICGLTAANVKQIGGFFWMFSDPVATSDGSGSDYKWVKEDGKYVPAVLSTKLALPSLQNARDMYDMGIIDKDMAQIKGNQGYDKFVTGAAAALLEVGWQNINNQVNERWKKLYPDKPMLDSVKRVDYFPSTDGQRYHCIFKTYWSESYFSSKVDDKKMDRIMKLYDWMLQPDTKEFFRFGVKDTDYKKDGDKIIQVTKPEDLCKKQPSTTNLQCLVEFDDQFQYDPNNFTFDPVILKAAQDDLAYSRKVTKAPEYEVKLTYVSTPTKDKFSIMDHDFLLNIMMGKEPVQKMWDDLLKDYESKGLGKMIEEVNEKAKEMGLN